MVSRKREPLASDPALPLRLPPRPAWIAPVRVEQPELLDLGFGSPAEVSENLSEMWRINRDLGGLRALTRHLHPRLLAAQNPITLADLGTGSADVPVAMVRWARAQGLKIQVLAIDWAARNLAIAQAHIERMPEITLLRADAARLPLPPHGVDFIISSLFLHHFTPAKIVELLGAAFAHARRGIIMTDLVRGWLPYAAFKLVQPIFARNRLTRADGALSIRRAYRPDELRKLAQAAGLPNAKVYTHWPWRMTLVMDREIEYA
jgi:hypothetical protein